MYRLSITILISISFIYQVLGQDITFTSVDKETYKLYKLGKWQELIDLGNDAVKNGFDYYYLRMRIGIAYYEKGQYRSAIKQFKKALLHNSKDSIAAEYLYYSYLFSGRKMDVYLTYAKYEKLLLSRKIPNPLKFINGLYIESGLKMISPKNDSYGNLFNAHLGFEHQLSSRINLYHGYTIINQNIYNYEFIPMLNGSRLIINETKRKYSQDEYFIKGTIALSHGTQLTGSWHTQAINDTISFNNNSYWVGLKTNLKFIDLNFSYGKSIIAGAYHDQVSGDIIIYPFSNLNLYLQSMLTYHFPQDVSNMILYQKVGLRAGRKTWLELYGAFGEQQNTQDYEGFYLYNLKNILNQRLGLSILTMVGQKSKLILGYINENYEELDTGLPYNQNYIFIGLNLHFKD